MANDNDKPNGHDGRLPEDKATARRWFEKAKSVLDTKNYDYAIECYVNGLECWPEAVDEGHKPLYLAAMYRAAAAGKRPGTLEIMKRPMNCKDRRRAMLNAEFLMAKDPKNPTYLEGLFKNAVKSGCLQAAMWAGPLLQDAAIAEKKPSPARFRLLSDTYAELSEQFVAAGGIADAIEAQERAVQAMARLCQVQPTNYDAIREKTELATKLTILKGKYDTADSFKDSVRDATGQADIHDTDRLVQSADRLDDLVAKARADVAANPDVPTKITNLVDLLCKREEDQYENEAIETLERAYRKSDNYLFKRRADDIRMRQLRRENVRVRASGDREAAKAKLREQLRFELAVFRERVEQYPTDMRVRFDYAKRLFLAHDFERAIPVFQEARNDPRSRMQCDLYIGRCFYEKQYYDQAMAVLTDAIERLEVPNDDTGKELRYWLGRSHEAAEQPAEAMKVYGQLLQWDYNYKDVRQRMDNLRAKR